MTIDLAVGPVQLDRQLAAIVRRLNSQKELQVLLFNQYGGNGFPSAFVVSEAELHARKGKNKPFISLRASGPVYELKNGLWLPDEFHPWGRNFLAEGKESYIVVGFDEITQTLRSKLQYNGKLPFKN